MVCLSIIGHFLKGCCPVSLLHLSCGLLGLEEMAATGIVTASESREVVTSLLVSAAASAFCVPELELGGASNTLVGAVVFTVSETFVASLGHLAHFVGHV